MANVEKFLDNLDLALWSTFTHASSNETINFISEARL